MASLFFKKKRLNFLCKPIIIYKKYTAFTLAEVLITLGIIGVVASITIPTVFMVGKMQ